IRSIGTMLIVAHRLSTVQHADNIIVLSKGVIVEQGDHQQLLRRKGQYYQLYTLQFNKQQLMQGFRNLTTDFDDTNHTEIKLRTV
ncbi:MAG: hypothetical protein IJ049_01765, partial [Oscillospiraceae bacterium]|nr:hypothetical protein [Oscillospiraceae bacterium]